MTTANDDLRSLIDAASAKPDSPKPAPGRTAAPTGPAPATAAPSDDIRALVQHAAGSSAQSTAAWVPVAAPKSSNRRSNTPVDLGHAVQQARADGDKPATASGKPSLFKKPAVIASSVTLLLAVSALGLWQTSQPSLSGHPATLQQLAQSVEQFRHSRNGRLPEQLSNLENFPKNAVEWQLTHWRARDAAGRTEVFWAPNGTRHYRIVLRHGSEVWVYNDIDGKSKQTNK